jgi:hypothetical protein
MLYYEGIDMVKAIDESLYRWEKDGWKAEKIENDQYTLVHPKARPVICGLRTQFQTVGTIQGEMQRALRDGPKPQPVMPIPSTNDMPRRVKTKRKPSRSTPTESFSFDDLPTKPAPVSPFRRRPAMVETPVRSVRQTLPFENAAWELAYLTLKTQQFEDHVIAIMQRRYQTDEQYRLQLIRNFQATPQAKIQALREQVKREFVSE